MISRQLILTGLLSLLAVPTWGLHLTLLNPKAGQPVFGTVLITAEVLPESEVHEVVFLVDDRIAGTRRVPPFELEVDLGEGNRPHVFEVFATDLAGRAFRTLLETPAVFVDLAIDVALQQLYLTVNDRGERVPDLERQDFRVLDNGKPQEIVTFERGDIPFVAALLVDASRSMEGAKLETALAGAQAFAAAMEPLDQAKLTLFNDTLSLSTPFTSFPQVLSAGLADARASGGTSLNDNLYLAMKLLEDRQGRRLVILLTDGVDLTSVLSMQQVMETARRSQSLIYWIRLGEPDPRVSHFSAWRDGEGHRRELRQLEHLVAVTGGRIVTLGRIAEINDAFATILDEIRNQYVIGYYPSQDLDNGRWHRIKVSVKGSGFRVRTRQGYLDF